METDKLNKLVAAHPIFRAWHKVGSHWESPLGDRISHMRNVHLAKYTFIDGWLLNFFLDNGTYSVIVNGTLDELGVVFTTFLLTGEIPKDEL